MMPGNLFIIPPPKILLTVALAGSEPSGPILHPILSLMLIYRANSLVYYWLKYTHLAFLTYFLLKIGM